MSHFVITIMDNPRSVECADRCIKSGKKWGNDIQKWEATTPKDDPELLFLREDLPIDGIREKYSRFQNCAAAFYSHYSLWKHCIQLGHDITIFEHDAVLHNSIPINSFKYVMNIGEPSYGKYNTPPLFGVNDLTSKRYLPGAHAYRVTPTGAKMLVQLARRNARPTDVFINLDDIYIQEYYPWIARANDSFTTIQKELGTYAKHNKVDIIDA